MGSVFKTNKTSFISKPYFVVNKITFITNEVWYSIKYHFKCIGNAIDISMHFSGFETAKELLFVMTLILMNNL